MSPKSTLKIPAASAVDYQFQRLLKNNTEGAAIIESKAIKLFMEMAGRKPEKWRDEIKMKSEKLRGRFSSMANILNLCGHIENLVIHESPRQFINALKGHQRDISNNRKRTVISASKAMAQFNCIFTISNSSSIGEALLKASLRGWRGQVLIAESRPKNEGSEFAVRLAKNGINTILAVDAAMPHFIALADAVFLGADAASPGLFLNKLGSKIAVDYAARYRIPCFIVFDKSKWIDIKNFPLSETARSAKEISRASLSKLTVFNKYFEAVVPIGKIRYICGDKLIKPKNVRRQSQSPLRKRRK